MLRALSESIEPIKVTRGHPETVELVEGPDHSPCENSSKLAFNEFEPDTLLRL